MFHTLGRPCAQINVLHIFGYPENENAKHFRKFETDMSISALGAKNQDKWFGKKVERQVENDVLRRGVFNRNTVKCLDAL